MLTPKEAREISEQRKKELEMEIPRKRDIRKVEDVIKQACDRGERECCIVGYNNPYDEIFLICKGDVIMRYLKSQGYTVDLFTNYCGTEAFLVMSIKW